MKLIKFIKGFFITILLLTVYTNITIAQIDSTAVVILDKMSNVICNLKTCSFKIKTEYDISDSRLGLVTHSEEANIFLKAPDKALINRKGDKGKKDLFYNGKTFTYFSYDNYQYATVQAPPTIMEMIDGINNDYGIDFPAADIFYSDFVDVILGISNNLSYLGLTTVEERECYHIAGTTNDFTFQIWIANDESYLPVKMVIVYTNQSGNPQYEALYQQWNLNPVLQNEMFDFAAPEKAIQVKILKKTKN